MSSREKNTGWRRKIATARDPIPDYMAIFFTERKKNIKYIRK